jgi:hypothetical protein
MYFEDVNEDFGCDIHRGANSSNRQSQQPVRLDWVAEGWLAS